MIISSTDQFHRSLWAQISFGGGRRQQTVCYMYDGPPESFPFQIVMKSRQLRTDHAATDPPTHILLFLGRKQKFFPASGDMHVSTSHFRQGDRRDTTTFQQIGGHRKRFVRSGTSALLLP